MALEHGDWTESLTYVGECLTIARDAHRDGSSQIAEALELRAALAAAQRAPLRALRLAGAAAALRAQLNRPLAPSEQATLERRLVRARQALSAGDQAQAWAVGQASAPEQAIADALD
jgi:hypothetical protein